VSSISQCLKRPVAFDVEFIESYRVPRFETGPDTSTLFNARLPRDEKFDRSGSG
jgi:hypothetical protein